MPPCATSRCSSGVTPRTRSRFRATCRSSPHRFRQACPEVTSGASASEVRRLVLLQKVGLARFAGDLGRALQIPVRYGPMRLITPGLVEAAHRVGVGIHVWTINDEPEMRELIDMGVDGLITDYPGRLIRLLGRE